LACVRARPCVCVFVCVQTAWICLINCSLGLKHITAVGEGTTMHMSKVFLAAVIHICKIQFLSTLPSKEVLRAQFLGVLQAPGTRLARTLKEAPASLVRVLAAKKE
ncbi:MAG: hypothetical protein WCH11_03340, partial [Bdellovibrio sp.]